MSAESTRTIYAIVLPSDTEQRYDTTSLAVAQQLTHQCGGVAHALIIGGDPHSAIESAQELGFEYITTLASPALLQTHQLCDLLATQVSEGGPISVTPSTLFLVSADARGEEFAGILAASLRATPLGKCDRFDVTAQGVLTATRAAFGARLNITINCVNGPFIAAVRKSETFHAPQRASTPNIQHLSATSAIRPAYAVQIQPHDEPHAPLDGARLIVSGGRGIGKPEAFELLYEIATKLGGAVGASLPAIDAGWAPVARQVGQSGKYVAPDIYLAVGISGTPQHLAGIAPHTKIIAINKDADASIFQVASVGAVADWEDLLPTLNTALN